MAHSRPPRPKPSHGGAQPSFRLSHQPVKQISGPAAGEYVMAAGTAILIPLQRNELVQQLGITQASLHFYGAQFGLHTATCPLLVLEEFGVALATLRIPGGIVAVGQLDLDRPPRLTDFAVTHPASDRQSRRIQQRRRLVQTRSIGGARDNAVIVVHRCGQRLHRAAAALMREISDRLCSAPKHGDGGTWADLCRHARELRPEVRTNQVRLGGLNPGPKSPVVLSQGLHADNFDFQPAHS